MKKLIKADIRKLVAQAAKTKQFSRLRRHRRRPGVIIEQADLSPFVITRIDDGRTRIRPLHPLRFTPYLDDGCIMVADDKYNVFVSGRTRSEVIEEINQRLAFAWRHYAHADLGKLTAKAARFSQTMRDEFANDDAK